LLGCGVEVIGMGVSVLVLVGRGVLVHVPVASASVCSDGVLVDVLVGVGVLVGSAVSVSCSARVACRIACRVAVWRGAGETTTRHWPCLSRSDSSTGR